MTLNFDTSKTVSEKWTELVRTAVPRCKNCRFWEKSKEYRAGGVMGDCSNDKMIADYDKDAISDGLLTEADEGWGFYVGQDFGCIHFEVKDGEEN